MSIRYSVMVSSSYPGGWIVVTKDKQTTMGILKPMGYDSGDSGDWEILDHKGHKIGESESRADAIVKIVSNWRWES